MHSALPRQAVANPQLYVCHIKGINFFLAQLQTPCRLCMDGCAKMEARPAREGFRSMAPQRDFERQTEIYTTST